MTKFPMVYLCASMLFCGCKTTPPRHLSKAQVIELAQRVGAGHGQELRVYEIVDVFYGTGTWYVSFVAKKAYAYDDRWDRGFGVEVEDATGATKYDEHPWK